MDEINNEKLLTAEKAIEEDRRALDSLAKTLRQVRDRKLYRPEYDSFKEYCFNRLDMDYDYANQLINSAPDELKPISVPPGWTTEADLKHFQFYQKWWTDAESSSPQLLCEGQDNVVIVKDRMRSNHCELVRVSTRHSRACTGKTPHSFRCPWSA